MTVGGLTLKMGDVVEAYGLIPEALRKTIKSGKRYRKKKNKRPKNSSGQTAEAAQKEDLYSSTPPAGKVVTNAAGSQKKA